MAASLYQQFASFASKLGKLVDIEYDSFYGKGLAWS